jgi:endonuclease/exonuclease/phosphatase family metal-dependent hydrolase
MILLLPSCFAVLISTCILSFSFQFPRQSGSHVSFIHQRWKASSQQFEFPNFDTMTKKRDFIPLPGSFSFAAVPSRIRPNRLDCILRVLQFNVLADGLSGLREDLGDFSEDKRDILNWEYRKEKLLYEILQYDADIVTLQEVDHYLDFFWPEMLKYGYIGFYAPKPTSKCLEVGENADGCAMFLKSSRLRVLSAETKALAFSKAELTESGELNEDEKNIRAQNQVALIALCELLDEHGNVVKKHDVFAPPIIICTTHLKSVKSPVGERYRVRGISQVLESLEQVYANYEDLGRSPAVLLTGDFNALPVHRNYPPLTYQTVKASSLSYRSIYNDDVMYSPARLSCQGEFYTQYKHKLSQKNMPHSHSHTHTHSGQDRTVDSNRVVIKQCIDYIFYVPYLKSTIATVTAATVVGDENHKDKKLRAMRKNRQTVSSPTSPIVSPVSVITKQRLRSVQSIMIDPLSLSRMQESTALEDQAFSDGIWVDSPIQIALSTILRFVVYFFGALIPATSFLSETLDLNEHVLIVILSMAALIVFELKSEGSIFKPRVRTNRPLNLPGNMPCSVSLSLSSSSSSSPSSSSSSNNIQQKADNNNANANGNNNGNTTWIFSAATSLFIPWNQNLQQVFEELKNSETVFLSNVGSWTQKLVPLPQYGRPGFQPVAALDVFPDDELGDAGLPSAAYPSDHIAIAADLELLW